jgi:predicted nucleic acid-binding protein
MRPRPARRSEPGDRRRWRCSRRFSTHAACMAPTYATHCCGWRRQALWSASVLDELERNLLERGLAKEAVTYRISEMRRAFPDAEVRGYESLVESMTCDPKDRHVLAAAVRSDAEVLVTFNIRDFPDSSVAAYDITIVDPDDFLLDQLDLYPGSTIAALRDQASSYTAPAMSVEDLLGRLSSAGVPKFAAETRRHL